MARLLSAAASNSAAGCVTADLSQREGIENLFDLKTGRKEKD
jgi:hypothetical protein